MARCKIREEKEDREYIIKKMNGFTTIKDWWANQNENTKIWTWHEAECSIKENEDPFERILFLFIKENVKVCPEEEEGDYPYEY